MNFYLVSYEIHAQENGQVMIAKLVKETELQKSNLVGIKTDAKKTGIAGTLELYVYDPIVQERMKVKVGQSIVVDVKI